MLDTKILSNAKVVYAVLESVPKVATRYGSAVFITHREISEKSGLSHHTVVKALTRLERAGWLAQARSAGSANTYIFTTPDSET